MKKILPFFTLLLLACGHGGMVPYGHPDSTSVLRSLYSEGHELFVQQQPDSALGLFLRAMDFSEGCSDKGTLYQLLNEMSSIYEQKNLFSLQSEYLRKMLREAQKDGDEGKMGEVYYKLGISSFAQREYPQALSFLNKAISVAPEDSSMLCAKSRLMQCQIQIQQEDFTKAAESLQLSVLCDTCIKSTDLYHLSEVYLLYYQDDLKSLETLICNYAQTDNPYSRIEQTRLLMALHESRNQQDKALEDAYQLMSLQDSVSRIEASESTARIHALQHESQMKLAAEQQKNLKERSRNHIMFLLWVLLVLIIIATSVIRKFLHKAKKAHVAELEALRLAEVAQNNESEVRALNEDLQRRYYEHLYAILLPILNANRGNGGHIDLNEQSWKLIEENTDLVLPNFTKQLRRHNPGLTDEDVRFCCLVAMKVPTSILSNIYGIAPGSVAMRKQRMKQKMDENLSQQTLETYLSTLGL